VLKETDSILIDAKNFNFDYLRINDNEFLVIGNENQLNGNIKYDFKPSKDNVMLLKYRARPEKALYFLDRLDANQIWTQGQGKYTSNWLPSFDDVNEKVEFDLTIVFEDSYNVI